MTTAQRTGRRRTTTTTTTRKSYAPSRDRKTQEVAWREMLTTALTVPGSLRGTYSRFYDYSYNNLILLAIQGVSSPVATYKRWEAMGYQVRKGSKAKSILRPIVLKVTDTDPNTGEETERKFARFKMVKCLFTADEVDSNRADPDPIPDAPVVTWDADKALAELKVRRVPFELLDGNTQGYSALTTDPDYVARVAVSPVALYPVKTLMHELGHVVCGHLGEAGKHEPRGVMEFQAEATALLVLKELGYQEFMDESVTRAYIQCWLGDTEPTDEQIRTVFGAVQKIISAGSPADETQENGE